MEKSSIDATICWTSKETNNFFGLLFFALFSFSDAWIRLNDSVWHGRNSCLFQLLLIQLGKWSALFINYSLRRVWRTEHTRTLDIELTFPKNYIQFLHERHTLKLISQRDVHTRHDSCDTKSAFAVVQTTYLACRQFFFGPWSCHPLQMVVAFARKLNDGNRRGF